MKNVRSAYVLSKTLLTDFMWCLGFITDCYVYKYTVRVMGKNIIKSIWLFSWVSKSPAMKLIDRYSLLVTGEVSFIFVKPFLFSRQENDCFKSYVSRL